MVKIVGVVIDYIHDRVRMVVPAFTFNTDNSLRLRRWMEVPMGGVNSPIFDRSPHVTKD